MGDGLLRARPVAGSVEELLVGATSRVPMDKHVDSLSGSPFERVVIDGVPHVLKHVGYDDVHGLLWPGGRYMALTPATGDREAAAASNDPVPQALGGGWNALRRIAPEAHDHALALATDPTPLVDALAETPATLIHGDW